jgi:hypothetical protein
VDVDAFEDGIALVDRQLARRGAARRLRDSAGLDERIVFALTTTQPAVMRELRLV